MTEILNTAMQWFVAPIAGFVFVLYNKVQDHATSIAVLTSKLDANKDSHDREVREIKETTNKIFAKLDSIEESLRK